MQHRYPCLRCTNTLLLILVCLRMFIGSVLSSDCKWNVTSKNYCPEYLSSTWNCLAWNKACHDIDITVYHCARDYNNKDKFTEACANEQDCRLAKEPQIRHDTADGATATVTCELCHGNRYNDRPSQSSATFWRCPEEQPQFTNVSTHLINCNYTSTSDLKSKRQWARCDAEHNYIPEANDTVYDSIGCSNDKDLHCNHVETCPNGEERVENYTCVATQEQPTITTTGRQDSSKPDDPKFATTMKTKDNSPENETTAGGIAGVIVGVIVGVSVLAIGIVVFVVLSYRSRIWKRFCLDRQPQDKKVYNVRLPPKDVGSHETEPFKTDSDKESEDQL